MTYANNTIAASNKSGVSTGATHTHIAHLSLPAGALALRALRPSFRSILLPVRFVKSYVYSVHCSVPTDAEFWPTREIPVYVRQRRSASVQH